MSSIIINCINFITSNQLLCRVMRMTITINVGININSYFYRFLCDFSVFNVFLRAFFFRGTTFKCIVKVQATPLEIWHRYVQYTFLKSLDFKMKFPIFKDLYSLIANYLIHVLLDVSWLILRLFMIWTIISTVLNNNNSKFGFVLILLEFQ